MKLLALFLFVLVSCKEKQKDLSGTSIYIVDTVSMMDDSTFLVKPAFIHDTVYITKIIKDTVYVTRGTYIEDNHGDVIIGGK